MSGLVPAHVPDNETYLIIGAAMEVHRVLGCGFLEAVYHAALLAELLLRGIPVRTEVSFPVSYKNGPLPVYYRADLMCFDSVIVEAKASSGLTRIDEAQAINYMNVSGLKRAPVLNFGLRSLQHRRFVLGL
jgi:GxxExxY protein